MRCNFWRLGSVVIVLLAATACGSQPIRIESAQVVAKPTIAKRSDTRTFNRKAADTAAASPVLCGIEWRGLEDARSVKDPIGYVVAKPVIYPELVTDLDRRIGETLAGVKQSASLALKATLLRASIEQRSTLIKMDLTFRLSPLAPGMEPVIFIASTRKALMTGSDNEGVQFVRTALQGTTEQFIERLRPVCRQHERLSQQPPQ